MIKKANQKITKVIYFWTEIVLTLVSKIDILKLIK